MKIITINKTQLTLTIFILICMLAFLFTPATYMNATLSGIIIWANNVVPALFPFLFFTKLLTELKVVDKLSKHLEKLMQKLFHTSGISAFIYLMSIISGYPIGAKLSSEFYLNGTISKNELVRINSFTSTSGPLFIIGSVGVSMFQSTKLGYIVLLSHLLGSILNGLLYRNYHYSKNLINTLSTTINKNTNNILGDSVYNSIISILIVGAYIALCSIFIQLFINIGLFNIISTPLNYILNIPLETTNAILTGIIEMTNGCLNISQLNLDTNTATIIICGLISFGGLSINLQALTFLSKCKINIPFYFLQKTTQCILSMCCCVLLTIIL